MHLFVEHGRGAVIVLCGFDWSDLVRTIAWEDDDGVMVRTLDDDGSTFDRRSTRATLVDESLLTSSYWFQRPIEVTTLQEALWLLGNDIAVLDLFPDGRLSRAT
jgi:hypothetical protein